MSRRAVAIPASLVLLLTVAGCTTHANAGSASPVATAPAPTSASPTPRATATLTPTPASSPIRTDAAVPDDCESFVPIGRIEDLYVPRLADAVISSETASIDAFIRESEILDIALTAGDMLVCGWGQPRTDNTIGAAAVQVDDEARARVIADLRSHDYDEVARDGVVEYAKTFDDGDERLHPWSNVVHLIDGDVWIVAIDHFESDSLAGDLASAALDGARNASR
ncbi:hypothetical protein LJR045_000166 [Microbacterium sp. LjRoot45]|uniref:hypothetical protein n=1 Tax=Microbacterium sp. LjRoot45 TaxID=3342329 RepID=UPI003ECEA4ED